MKVFILLLFISVKAFSQKPLKLFDGKTFKGWEGDTVKTWRISDGMLIGGSLTEKVPHNEFISTTTDYKNFILQSEIQTGRHGRLY